MNGLESSMVKDTRFWSSMAKTTPTKMAKNGLYNKIITMCWLMLTRTPSVEASSPPEGDLIHARGRNKPIEHVAACRVGAASVVGAVQIITLRIM